MAREKNTKIMALEGFDRLRAEISQTSILKDKVEFGPLTAFPSAISEETKVLIVGTVAPATSKTYFYTSPFSKMYEVLDSLFGTNMRDMKNNQRLLVETLTKHKIAFLDVFEQVLRKKDSSLDDDILFGKLNFTAFRDVLCLLPEDAIIIPVSTLSASLFKNILAQLNMGKWTDRTHYCSIFKYVPTKEMINDWKRVLIAYSEWYRKEYSGF